MGKLQNILDGFSNYYFPKPEVEALAKTRAKECGGCEHAVHGKFLGYNSEDRIVELSGMRCNKCGCGLSEKLRAPAEKCPINKW